MLRPHPQPSSEAPPRFWDLLLGCAKQLFGSVEVRSVLCSVLVVWLTSLLGAGTLFLVVIALLLGFLIGTAFGPAILAKLAGNSGETLPADTTQKRITSPEPHDVLPNSAKAEAKEDAEEPSVL